MVPPANDLCDLPNVHVTHGFLDVALCERLIEEMRQGARVPATISTAGGYDIADEGRRRTSRIVVSERGCAEMIERFKAVAAELGRFFQMVVPMLQRPQFLLYQRGDFFRPHQDSSQHPDHDRQLRARAISAVVFLNGQVRLPRPDAYCGGELRLFQPARRSPPGVSITGERGLMVAFPSHILHEVRPVTYGERYTVVTWYLNETARTYETS